MDSKAMMSAADKALYRSKEMGRNKVVIKLKDIF